MFHSPDRKKQRQKDDNDPAQITRDNPFADSRPQKIAVHQNQQKFRSDSYYGRCHVRETGHKHKVRRNIEN
jgi:hypothetical protein